MSYVNAPSASAYAPTAINSVFPNAQNQQQSQQAKSCSLPLNPDGSVNYSALMQMLANGSQGCASSQGASPNASNPISSTVSGVVSGLGSALGSLYTGATGSLGMGSDTGNLMATYGL